MGRRKKRGRPQVHRAQKRSEDGRVHLVVSQDESGKTSSLSLSRDLFRTEWQNRLTLATASTVHGLLGDSLSEPQLLALCRKVLDAASAVGTRAVSSAGAPPAACAPGCDHCCHQSVGASPLEILTIARFLQDRCTAEKLSLLRARVETFCERTRTLSVAERHHPALPCPLLDGGRCTVYEVRPLSCRGVNSLDADLCRRSLRDADGRDEYLAGRLEIPRYAEPMRASHAVSAGLQLSASELHGLAMEPVELAWGLSIALTDPARTMKEFLSGHDPLCEARGGTLTKGSDLDEQMGLLP